MLNLLKELDALVWGPPLLILLVGTGIYLTLRLGLLQILRLPKAFQLIFIKDKAHGDISSFAALCTALAATVGTGNIIGGWQRLSKLVAQELSFGCGWQLFLEWQPCMQKDYLPLNTGLRMTMVRLRVVRCTISF